MLAAAAARELRGQGTTLDPFDPTRASVLVTTGANAVSRNPMYVGLAGLLLSNQIAKKIACPFGTGKGVARENSLERLSERGCIGGEFPQAGGLPEASM